LGIGDWGLGIWGLGGGAQPHDPKPTTHDPTTKPQIFYKKLNKKFKIYHIINI